MGFAQRLPFPQDGLLGENLGDSAQYPFIGGRPLALEAAQALQIDSAPVGMEPVDCEIEQAGVVAPDLGGNQHEGFGIYDPIALGSTVSRNAQRGPLTPKKIEQLAEQPIPRIV